MSVENKKVQGRGLGRGLSALLGDEEENEADQ